MTLVTDFNLGTSGDDLYEALLNAHRDLSPEESAALNARLVLILMNHVGKPQVIHAAIDAAKRTGGPR